MSRQHLERRTKLIWKIVVRVSRIFLFGLKFLKAQHMLLCMTDLVFINFRLIRCQICTQKRTKNGDFFSPLHAISIRRLGFFVRDCNGERGSHTVLLSRNIILLTVSGGIAIRRCPLNSKLRHQ